MNTKKHCASSNEPIRCAIYARTATQPPNGNNSIEQQIEQCREAARERGWTVVENCVRADCGKSGTTIDQRTGLHDLMALAATRPRPFNYLMCTSTDRLARNLDTASAVIGSLTFNGVNLYFVSGDLDSADPRFWGPVCAMVSQYQSFSEELGTKNRRGKLRSKLAATENQTAAVPAASTR